MLIRANLYADILERERKDRYHPARLGWAAAIAFVLVAGWYGWSLNRRVDDLGAQTAAAQAKEEALSRELVTLRERAKTLQAKVERRRQILRRADERVNWATIMEKVFRSVPPHVQLSSLKFQQNRDGSCLIDLDGRALGRDPRAESEKFRLLVLESLAGNSPSAQASFIRLEEAQETQGALDANRGDLAMAEFSLKCTWRKVSDER